MPLKKTKYVQICRLVGKGVSRFRGVETRSKLQYLEQCIWHYNTKIIIKGATSKYGYK